MKNLRRLLCGAALLAGLSATAQVKQAPVTGYKKPPKEIEELLLAKPAPSTFFNNQATVMVNAGRDAYPTLAELARPELRVAGIRINPANYSQSRQVYYNTLSITTPLNGRALRLKGLPSQLAASGFVFNTTGTKLAFINTGPSRADVYVIDCASGLVSKINRLPLNNVLQNGVHWVGNNALLYCVATRLATEMPKQGGVPFAPAIQQTSGKSAPNATYQDLIRTRQDEDAFNFLAESAIAIGTNGSEKVISKPGLYMRTDVSPDKQYVLAETIERPFSYLVGYNGFPSRVAVLDMAGKVVKTLAVLPSAEVRPSGYDNIQNVPRGFTWRGDLPATVVWSKPLDSGIIKKQVPYHDAVYGLNAPFTGTEQLLFKTRQRYRGTIWGTPNLAWVSEGLTSKQSYAYSLYRPATGSIETLFTGNTTDAYNEPGTPVTTTNKYGRNTISYLADGHSILLNNVTGASAKGDLPYLARFNTSTRQKDIVWRSEEDAFSYVADVIDPDALKVILRRESKLTPANYYMGTCNAAKLTQLTFNKNPYTALANIAKQKVYYKRADGIGLTGTLYLPAGFTPGKSKPLPTLIWAYPREFNAAADAGQVRGSDNRFTTISWASPVFWVTQGYAILDAAEMPITGSEGKRPNDNFVQQLEMNAAAAINKLATMGVTDTARVAVGGHSYGAFMTANLLAHTNLFAAGIARSGAYNRTLTPFGFQNEDRTYWQAPDLYYKMSPFSYADKIKRPLLMIHGELDDNPGTFPINSERLFNAIKGNGGTAKLVFLPFEAHSYRAKENLLHMLFEQDEWLEKYVKNKK